MSNSFFKYLCTYFFIVLALTLFICFSVFQVSEYGLSLNSSFIWPLPGYSYISSYFGYRISPTSGASTYHSGIDIPAPEGTDILAVCSGTVTFASWGAGGRLYYCCGKWQYKSFLLSCFSIVYCI